MRPGVRGTLGGRGKQGYFTGSRISDSLLLYQKTMVGHSVRLRRVVSGAVTALVVRTTGNSCELNFNPPEVGVGQTLRWVVGQQVLGPEFIANGAECLIELRERCRVVVFAAGVFGHLNERMFAARVAPGAGLNRHNDDPVDNRLRLLRRP